NGGRRMIERATVAVLCRPVRLLRKTFIAGTLLSTIVMIVATSANPIIRIARCSSSFPMGPGASQTSGPDMATALLRGDVEGNLQIRGSRNIYDAWQPSEFKGLQQIPYATEQGIFGRVSGKIF